MSSDAAAIEVAGLSKCYTLYDQPSDRLRQFVLPRLQRISGLAPRRYYREFWALRDVSFDVRRGETMGIVGRNGAGKSTLLQIICGTLTPTSGTVRIAGRIAALLELGSGFNPDFTGLENVYLNATLLGLSRPQIDARLDAILSFADIGDFVREPVKTYSSGMVVRLAFAVQAQVEPDVMVVDEALAVGDARFQAKCFARLKALRDAGTTILFVSHSTEQVVTHCSRAVLIDGGQLLEIGEPRRVANRYLDLLFGRTRVDASDAPGTRTPEPPSTALASPRDHLAGADESFLDPAASAYEERPLYNPHEYRWGDKRASLLDFMLLNGDAPVAGAVATGTRLRVVLKFRFDAPVVHPILGVTLKTREGVTVYGSNSEMQDLTGIAELGAPGSVHFASFEFESALAGGDYFISVGIASRDGIDVVPHDRRYDSIHFSVSAAPDFIGLVDLAGRMRLVSTAAAVHDLHDAA
jgi:lipopolysaccharide transport system ATP-binding protein